VFRPEHCSNSARIGTPVQTSKQGQNFWHLNGALLSHLGSASSQRVYVSRITLCRLISVSSSRFTLLPLLFAPHAAHPSRQKKKGKHRPLSISASLDVATLYLRLAPCGGTAGWPGAMAGPTPRAGASASASTSAAPAPPCALQFSLARRRRRAKCYHYCPR
jgi:hypothetical protein